MSYDNAEGVIEEHFELLRSRYQIGLEKSMRGSNLIFDCVHYCITNIKKISKSIWMIYRLSYMQKIM